MQSERFASKLDEIGLLECRDDRGVMGREVVEEVSVPHVAHRDVQQVLRVAAGLVGVTEVCVLRHHDTTLPRRRTS